MTIGDIYGLLRRLGLSADNSGFFHISYAVYLAFQQPARGPEPGHPGRKPYLQMLGHMPN